MSFLNIMALITMYLHLAFALVIQGVMATGLFVSVNQTSCYGNDAILKCPFYEEDSRGQSLRWRVRDPVSSDWENLALIRRGRMRMLSFSQKQFGDRLVLHSNGSLLIKSLREHDETHYQCIVGQRGRKDVHLTELSLACHGHATLVKQEVCTEENVTLQCNAKDRANPRKINRVTWHKKDSKGVWSVVASTDRGDLESNSSLVVKTGSDVGKEHYRCAVSKNYTGSRDERHFVLLTRIRCNKGSMKTTSGRVVLATSSPVNTAKGSLVTSLPPTTLTPTKAKNVCGGSLTSISGGFHSPNYPKAYPANSYCKWTITVPQDYTAIHITLSDVNLEHEDNCQNDYIAIYDELGNQVGCRRCSAYKSAIATVVKGRQAVIVFKSDSTAQKTGFKLDYLAAKYDGQSAL